MAHRICCPLNERMWYTALKGKKSFVVSVYLDGEGKPSYGRAFWLGPRRAYPGIPEKPFPKRTSAAYNIIVTPRETKHEDHT